MEKENVEKKEFCNSPRNDWARLSVTLLSPTEGRGDKEEYLEERKR